MCGCMPACIHVLAYMVCMCVHVSLRVVGVEGCLSVSVWVSECMSMKCVLFVHVFEYECKREGVGPNISSHASASASASVSVSV